MMAAERITTNMNNRFTIFDIVVSFLYVIMGFLIIFDLSGTRTIFLLASVSFSILSLYIIIRFNHYIIRALHLIFVVAFLLPVIFKDKAALIFSKELGYYFILVAIIQFASGRVAINDDRKYALKNIITGLVNLSFAIALIVLTIDNTVMRVLVGIRLFLTGLQLKSPILINHPVIFDVCLPYFMMNLYPSSQEIKSYEDEKNILKLRIGTGDRPIDFIAHTELGFDGKVYTFGNYNKMSRQFFNMYGDGIVTVADEDSMNRFGRLIKQTTFEYILKLTDDEYENVRERLERLSERSTLWEPEEKTRYHRVMDRIAHAKAFKIDKGPARHYFVLAMNCVAVKNYVTEDMDLPNFGFAEAPVPGTTLYLIDTAYRQGHDKVLARNIVNG